LDGFAVPVLVVELVEAQRRYPLSGTMAQSVGLSLAKFKFYKKIVDNMEKIEIPRFLLSYFDSMTIRTPLSSIMGHSQAMLKGVDGPLNEDMQKDLEEIHRNADWLFQYWSFAIKVVHYVRHEPEVNLNQVSLNDLINQCKEIINRYSTSSVELQIPEESLPIEADLSHTENIFDCLGRLTSDVYERANGKIIIKVFQNIEATAIEFELNKTSFTKSKNFNLHIEPYLFVMQRVMELHGGKFTFTNTQNNKLSASLVFLVVRHPKPSA
jgi:hypothetical protein